MQKISIIRIIGCALLMLFSIKQSYSQQSAQSIANLVNEILKYTGSIYGSDDRLITGKYYVPTHPLALGHPYLISRDWLPATLYIKGVIFNDVEVKYNIEDDLIILKRQYEQGLVDELLLNNSYIDSVRISGHLFINTSLVDEKISPGYFEQIYNGGFVAYLKHKNSYKDELSPQMMYGKYMEPKTTLYLFDDNQLLEIASKKELMTHFSPNEKMISRFMKQNKIRFRKAIDEQFIKLLNYCDEL